MVFGSNPHLQDEKSFGRNRINGAYRQDNYHNTGTIATNLGQVKNACRLKKHFFQRLSG